MQTNCLLAGFFLTPSIYIPSKTIRKEKQSAKIFVAMKKHLESIFTYYSLAV